MHVTAQNILRFGIPSILAEAVDPGVIRQNDESVPANSRALATGLLAPQACSRRLARALEEARRGARTPCLRQQPVDIEFDGTHARTGVTLLNRHFFLTFHPRVFSGAIHTSG